MRYPYLCLLAIVALCLFGLPVRSQELPHGTGVIEKALQEKRTEAAAMLWEADVPFWIGQSNLDTLTAYVSLKAWIVYQQKGSKAAIRETYRFIDDLLKKGMTTLQAVIVYRQAAVSFESIYELPSAYQAMNKAGELAAHLNKDRDIQMAACAYNMGVFAYNMGNIALSEQHHRAALAICLADTARSAEQLYFSYSAIGSIQWHALQYDSARYFYTKAIGILERLPDNPLNRHLRPAIIQNNLLAIDREEGRWTEAQAKAYEVIRGYRNFLESPGYEDKKQAAAIGFCAAIENLAGIYTAMGDYQKAAYLFRYAYQQKKERLGSTYPGVFISELFLGQHYHQVRDHQKAERYLLNALIGLEEANGDYTFWKADALHTLAQVYEKTNRITEAAQRYEESEQRYEEAYAGKYDNMYLDFLRSKALFYANHDRYAESMRTAGKIGRYLKKLGEEKGMQGFYYLQNLAEIHYQLGKSEQAIRYAKQADAHLNRQFRSGSSLLDSVRTEMHRPRLLLIQAKSAYAIRAVKDSVFLTGIYRELDKALQAVERKKLLIEDQENINLLLAEHQELIDFFARISLELYHKKFGLKYLERFINIKEAALYGRIRSRLNQEQAIRFAQVPDAVIQEEQELKQAMQGILTVNKADAAMLDNYLALTEQWTSFLEKIKKDYPSYYRLRYATLLHTLPELQHIIPDSTTLVRYYMVDTVWVALVADRRQQRIIPIHAPGLKEKIDAMQQYSMDEAKLLPLLHELYLQLWAPLEGALTTSKIMVIPDGLLYHISMDMLPFEPVDRFYLLKEKALLSRHTLSYHYSLFMLGADTEKKELPGNYIAFVPGFSDEMKRQYAGSVSDPVHLDKSYLALLPQPANNRLARELKNLIGGTLFLGESSTATAFRERAGNHKIIHVATHAAYNNLSPAFSGLYFARGAGQEANYFFPLKDIYACHMPADLMILTACETGKPGFQDGEGLVSLAHAFNYAGSRNILTALWKIDEQSSAAIAALFVQKLKAGIPTDEALRLAKLAYLSENEGRLLAPAYWSGLVLLGNPDVLSLNSASSNNIGWRAGGVGLLIIALWGWLRSRKKKQA